MSFENPGDNKRCDHCNRYGKSYVYRDETFSGLIHNQGETLCPPCNDRSVAADYAENGLRVVEDGRPTVYRAGYVTPRSRNYR